MILETLSNVVANAPYAIATFIQEGGEATVGWDPLSLWRQMGPLGKTVVIILFIMSAWSIGVMIDRWIAFNAARKQSRAFAPAVAGALRRYRRVAEIVAPATLDGGDVLRVGRRLLVGDGPRTNETGRTQLASLVEPHGYTVEAIAFDGCLHLKTAVTLVADDVMLCNQEWVSPGALGMRRVIEVDPSEPFAGNALRIHARVLHPAEFSRTAERLRRSGVDVLAVPAGELAKAEGGLTCGSLLVAQVKG